MPTESQPQDLVLKADTPEARMVAACFDLGLAVTMMTQPEAMSGKYGPMSNPETLLRAIATFTKTSSIAIKAFSDSADLDIFLSQFRNVANLRKMIREARESE